MSYDECMQVLDAALDAADPYRALLRAVSVGDGVLHAGGASYPLAAYRRILLVGAGKATARMAAAIETLLGERLAAGLIIVKYGHAAELTRVQQMEAAHPLPDAAGVAATLRILELVRSADDGTLLICLLSGGASALLVAPVAGITLHDKQLVTSMLLKAGASINELNAVRKHLSRVKGGRLAQAARPATVLTLILSDVIGNPLDVIASGPTAPDQGSFAEAWEVLAKYQLTQKIPAAVAQYLQAGLAGAHAETIRADDPCLAGVRNVIVGSNEQALAAAGRKAQQLGWPVRLLTSTLHGEARVAAQWLAQQADEALDDMRAGEKRCLLAGGETTVSVAGTGLGGRNQELALAFALEIQGRPGIQLLAAGTDGSDGPTDAAGALVDGTTVLRAWRHGIEAAAYLRNNDAWHFFQRLDARCGTHAHLKTGPTGTNVMDVQIILLEKDAGAMH